MPNHLDKNFVILLSLDVQNQQFRGNRAEAFVDLKLLLEDFRPDLLVCQKPARDKRDRPNKYRPPPRHSAPHRLPLKSYLMLHQGKGFFIPCGSKPEWQKSAHRKQLSTDGRSTVESQFQREDCWCPGQDLNLHALRLGILSPLCLPVS